MSKVDIEKLRQRALHKVRLEDTGGDAIPLGARDVLALLDEIALLRKGIALMQEVSQWAGQWNRRAFAYRWLWSVYVVETLLRGEEPLGPREWQATGLMPQGWPEINEDAKGVAAEAELDQARQRIAELEARLTEPTIETGDFDATAAKMRITELERELHAEKARGPMIDFDLSVRMKAAEGRAKELERENAELRASYAQLQDAFATFREDVREEYGD